MGASSHTLEVTVISAENVHITEEEAYVVVRAESLNCCTTKMAKDNGFLSWNDKLLVHIPVYARSITFEVQCKKQINSKGGATGGIVGVARIALSDLMPAGNSSSDQNCLQVLSYRLRDWEGRRNGVLHFSVRVVSSQELMMVASVKDSGHGVDDK